MPTETENALERAANKIASDMENVMSLDVKTGYVALGRGTASPEIVFEGTLPIARTLIRADGDWSTILPMRPGPDDQPILDSALLELHERNLTAAMEYRARMINALASALQSLLARTR